MSELKPGTNIRLQGGTSCTVEHELGRGGQGIVYRVDYYGKPYALKWYIVSYDNVFYDNLVANVSKGAPMNAQGIHNPRFLWPEAVTERQYNSFGYLMKLRPDNYKEIGQFLLGRARFRSMRQAIESCLQLCNAFRDLHLGGFSYGDLNDGNFFIDPATGDVLICDNDNVVPDGQNVSGITGKPGYMAPEIVEGERHPDRYSDYFSQAVVMFLLLYGNRPFEGLRATSCPCMTPENERLLNGKRAVFILDPDDTSNRPVRGMHNNVLRRWPLMPTLLNNKFQSAFSKESVTNHIHRVMDHEWQQIILQVRSLYAVCPLCGGETFVEIAPGKSTVCIDCDQPFHRPPMLRINRFLVPLLPKQKLYEAMVSIDRPVDAVMGEVVVSKSNPNLLGLRNTSSTQWTVSAPGCTPRLVNPGETMPVDKRLRIRFANGTIATFESPQGINNRIES